MVNKYPMSDYIFSNQLGTWYKTFVTSLSQIHISTKIREVLSTKSGERLETM